MGRRDLLFIVVCITGVLALVARIAPQTRSRDAAREAGSAHATYVSPTADDASVDVTDDEATPKLAADEAATVAAVDALFRRRWEQTSLTPAAIADELTIARRLSLALTGTIPSLAEIRELEAVLPNQRISWWRERLLGQRRTADYLAPKTAAY